MMIRVRVRVRVTVRVSVDAVVMMRVRFRVGVEGGGQFDAEMMVINMILGPPRAFILVN